MRIALGTADIVSAAVALTVASLVSPGAPKFALLVAPLAVIAFCKLGRLYDRDEHVIRKSTLDQAPAVLQVTTMYALAIWLSSDVLVDGSFTKPAIISLWATLLVSLIAFRAAGRNVAARVSPPERVLLLGGDREWFRLQSRFEQAHALNATLVGRVPLDGENAPHAPSLGTFHDLDYVLRSNGIDRVIIASGTESPDEQLDVIRLVKGLGVKVSLVPRLFEVVGSSMEFDDVDGVTLLGLRRYGLSKPAWWIKRTFDVTFATLGLTAIAPLLALIALAIRATSPGPILFRQPRVGRRGVTFQMLKFRTMYDGADQEKVNLRDGDCDGLFKLKEDPRITKVGRLLRRTSLDELPQLFNVLEGDMSLVGPRPLVEEEDRLIAGWHHRRREGTPGMTGVWQVLGSARVPLDDMVKMDYLYRANWSLWLDVKILLRTFTHVIGRRGL